MIWEKNPSLFENIFEDGSKLETKYYFYWVTKIFIQRYNGDLTQFESPHGFGYSFPSEEFEEIRQKVENIMVKQMRDLDAEFNLFQAEQGLTSREFKRARREAREAKKRKAKK